MNKKGQGELLALMLGTLFFVLGFALALPLTEVTIDAVSTMDCTNSSISDFTKGSCRLVEVTSPVFLGILFGLAGMLIGAKIT